MDGFVDGSFGASSGALYEPYINDPKNYGLLRILPEKLNNLAKQADEMGMQLSIHAIGDRALTYALNALSCTRNRFLRHRVEHIQLVNEEQLKKMKQLEVIAAIQPIFVSTDNPWAEKRLGRERIQLAYPLSRVCRLILLYYQKTRSSCLSKKYLRFEHYRLILAVN